MAENRVRFKDPTLSDDWREEVSTFQKTFDEVDDMEDDDFGAFLAAADFSEKRQRVLLLLDIAKRYLHPIEAEVMFLLLKNRRNKDISLILNIQEPEVVRYKRLIIKKTIIFNMFCYTIDISQYHGYVTELLQLNEKQSDILKLFLQFRSLSYISEQIQSKSSNMHRSLNSIREKLQELLPKHPELEPVLKFYEYSRYINNSNPDKTIVDDII
jgi:DNA-binding CsgD family transcriptional regulator